MRRLTPFLLALTLLLGCLPRATMAESGVMPLSAYPRPPGDNGRGLHWSPTLFGQSTDMVDWYVAEAAAMGITWVKLLQGDAPKLEHEYLIGELTERGIMPVLRVFKPTNEPYEHLPELVRLGLEAGVSYYELYNEPNLSGESGGWTPGESISVTRIVDLWVSAAADVRDAGGLPGLPALAPGGNHDDNDFLREFLRELVRRGRTDLLYGAWLPLHNYFLNHPLDYPYDDVNLYSTPLTDAEAAQRGLTPEQVSSINAARRDSRLPRSQGGYYVGDTIYDDSNGFLKFQAYARILEEEVGFLIPIITTEGGAIIGSAEDPRYPPVSEADLVDTTVGAFRYMEENDIAYYFAFAPWLIANRAGNSIESAWEGAAWYKEDGSTLAVVPAVKAMASSPSVATAPTAAATPTAQPSTQATSAPAPAATGTGSEASAPVADATATGQSASVALRTRSITLSVPEHASTTGTVTPAEATYPRPAAPLAGALPLVSGQTNAIVIASDVLEAWFLPDYGGRLIRLVDAQTGTDLLPLPTGLSSDGAGGSPRLAGGVAFLYPSASLPLVDDVAWQIDGAGCTASSLRLLLAEPRSSTRLVLEASVGNDGTVTLALTATNPNDTPRLVSLGIADAMSLFDSSGLGDQLLAPGGSHTWTLVRAGSGTPAAESSPARTPVALPTPIPYYTSTPTATGAATATAQATVTSAASPAVTRTATPNPAIGGIDWDSDLNDLGVGLVTPAGAAWRLVEATYDDESQSGGNHHIFIEYLDVSGDPCSPGDDVAWVSWKDGSQNVELKHQGDAYWSEFPMYGLLGAYTVGVGSNSDRVTGLGLPGKQHVNYRLTFQRQD